MKIDSFEAAEEKPKKYPKPGKKLSDKEIHDLVYPEILKSLKEGLKEGGIDD